MSICLNHLERNELEKAMLGRGVDYETIQLILKDFDARIMHLHPLSRIVSPFHTGSPGEGES